MISCGTGMVFHSFISERNAATLAIRCFVGALPIRSFWNHECFQENGRNEKSIKSSWDSHFLDAPLLFINILQMSAMIDQVNLESI